MEKRVVRFLLWFVASIVATGLFFFIVDVRTGRIERWGGDAVVGRVVEVSDSVITVRSGGKDSTFLITDGTEVRRGREAAGTPANGEFVVVFHEPGDAATKEARLIRILSADSAVPDAGFPRP